MAGGGSATIVVEILGHQMYLSWCPKCLLSQPFVRIYLRACKDASSHSMCLICGYIPFPHDDSVNLDQVD